MKMEAHLVALLELLIAHFVVVLFFPIFQDWHRMRKNGDNFQTVVFCRIQNKRQLNLCGCVHTECTNQQESLASESGLLSDHATKGHNKTERDEPTMKSSKQKSGGNSELTCTQAPSDTNHLFFFERTALDECVSINIVENTRLRP